MREINFRARNNEQNCWMYWQLNVEESRVNELARDIFFITADIKTLGEYTGLKDKNGKEIYEGDLLKFGGGRIVEVIFDQGAFAIMTSYGFTPLNQKQVNDNEIWGEVIGNIHENPELLQ